MHRDLHVGNVLHIGDEFLLADFGTAKTTIDIKVGSSDGQKSLVGDYDPAQLGDRRSPFWNVFI